MRWEWDQFKVLLCSLHLLAALSRDVYFHRGDHQFMNAAQHHQQVTQSYCTSYESSFYITSSWKNEGENKSFVSFGLHWKWLFYGLATIHQDPTHTSFVLTNANCRSVSSFSFWGILALSVVLRRSKRYTYSQVAYCWGQAPPIKISTHFQSQIFNLNTSMLKGQFTQI